MYPTNKLPYCTGSLLLVIPVLVVLRAGDVQDYVINPTHTFGATVRRTVRRNTNSEGRVDEVYYQGTYRYEYCTCTGTCRRVPVPVLRYNTTSTGTRVQISLRIFSSKLLVLVERHTRKPSRPVVGLRVGTRTSTLYSTLYSTIIECTTCGTSTVQVLEYEYTESTRTR